MSTIAVVDVITEYLMNFGTLLGDMIKRLYNSTLDKLPTKIKPLTKLRKGTMS